MMTSASASLHSYGPDYMTGEAVKVDGGFVMGNWHLTAVIPSVSMKAVADECDRDCHDISPHGARNRAHVDTVERRYDAGGPHLVA